MIEHKTDSGILQPPINPLSRKEGREVETVSESWRRRSMTRLEVIEWCNRLPDSRLRKDLLQALRAPSGTFRALGDDRKICIVDGGLDGGASKDKPPAQITAAKALIQKIKNGDESARAELSKLLSEHELQEIADVGEHQRSSEIIYSRGNLYRDNYVALELFSLVVAEFPSYFDQLRGLYLWELPLSALKSFSAARAASFQSLGTALHGLPQLQTLSLSEIQLGHTSAASFQALATALQGLSQLQKLSLRQSRLFQASAASLHVLATSLQGLPQLRSLNLERNWLGKVSAASFQVLATALQGLPQLRSLYLECNALGQISDASFQVLATALQGLPQLRSLDLKGNELGQTSDASFQVLATALQGLLQLQELNLAFNKLGQTSDASFRVLATALQGLPQLRLLYLGSNQLGEVSAASFQVLATALQGLPQLQELNLRYNQLGEASDASLQVLATALQGLPQLRSLDLEGNELNQTSDASFQAFCTALQGLPQLRSLDLKWNQLDEASAKRFQVLATALQGLPQLRSLDLLTNQLGQASIESFIQLDKQNAQKFFDFLCHTSQLIDTGLGGLLIFDTNLHNQHQQLLESNRQKLQTEAHQLGMQDIDLSDNDKTHDFCTICNKDPEFGWVTQLQKFELLKERQAKQSNIAQLPQSPQASSEINVSEEVGMPEENAPPTLNQPVVSLTPAEWQGIQAQIQAIQQSVVPTAPAFDHQLIQAALESVEDFRARQENHRQLQNQLDAIKNCKIKTELLTQLRTQLYSCFHYALAVVSGSSDSKKEDSISNILGVVGMMAQVIPIVGEAANLGSDYIKKAYQYRMKRRDELQQQALIINVPEYLKISIIETLCREIAWALVKEDILSDQNIEKSQSWVRKKFNALYKKPESIANAVYAKFIGEKLIDRPTQIKIQIKTIALNMCDQLLKGLVHHQDDLDKNDQRNRLVKDLIQGIMRTYASSSSTHSGTITWHSSDMINAPITQPTASHPAPTAATTINVPVSSQSVDVTEKTSDNPPFKKLQKDSEALKKEIEYIKNDDKAYKAEVTELRKKIDALTSTVPMDIEELQAGLRQKEAELRQQQSKINQLQSKTDRLEAEAAISQAQKSQEKIELQKRKNKINRLEADMAVFQAKQQLQKKDELEKQKASEALKAEVAKLHKKIEIIEKNTISLSDAFIDDGNGKLKLKEFQLDSVVHDDQRQQLFGDTVPDTVTLAEFINNQSRMINELYNKEGKLLLKMHDNEELRDKINNLENKIQQLEAVLKNKAKSVASRVFDKTRRDGQMKNR